MLSDPANLPSWFDALAQTAPADTRVSIVDAVPVLHGASTEADVFGALIFRVGYADETFASTGITHLVEHLALHGSLGSDIHANGQVDELFTIFHCRGESADVLRFLSRVSESLNALPLDRMEQEKHILSVEWQGRQGHPVSLHVMERYGHRGPGLAWSGELGLHRISSTDVLSWVATHFTAQNALLVFTADELPPGLSLRLPSGAPHPFPVRTSTLPGLPGFYEAHGTQVLVDAEVRRSTSAALFARVAQRTLLRRLRMESGLSYSVTSDYTPVDAKFARVTLTADASPDRLEELTDEFFDELELLRQGFFDPEDIAIEKRNSLRSYEDDTSIGMMMSIARNVMLGHDQQPLSALREELEAVTVEDMTAVASDFLRHALAQVPTASLARRGFRPSPRWSARTVAGTAHALSDGSGATLRVDSEGVSRITAPGAAATVRYSDCVGLLVYPDGGRVLIGADGFGVSIEPTVTPGLGELEIDALETRIAFELHVPMPPRDPAAIPRPAKRTWRPVIDRGLLMAVMWFGLAAAFLIAMWLVTGWLGVPHLRWFVVASAVVVIITTAARGDIGGGGFD